MKAISAATFLLGIASFASGCNDADLPNDEAGEAGASGIISPATDNSSSPETDADEPNGSVPPGAGDASGQIGSGVEAAGGGATGITEGADLSGEESGSAEGAKIETDGSDPGDS